MQETTLEFLEGQLSSRDSPQVSAQPGLVWESWGRGIDVGEEAPAEARGRVKVGTGQPVWPEFPSTRPTATKGVPTEPGHSPLSPEKLLSLPLPLPTRSLERTPRRHENLEGPLRASTSS